MIRHLVLPKIPFRLAMLVPLVLAGGCERNRTPSATHQTPSNVTASTPQPSSGPPQQGACPLEVRPGESLGPIHIGQSRQDLDKLGLPVKSTHRDGTTEFVEVGPFHAELCGGAVVDTWIDDLRKAPDCVMVKGKKVDRKLPRADVIALFSGCSELPPRTGGTFTQCHDGGVRIGYGMGDFIQIRVAKKGSDVDDTCEMVLDDGTPVPLPKEERAQLLQKVLDVDLLSPYWHVDQPGRDPLRIVKNDVMKDAPALTMFGSPVSYVNAEQAKKKNMAYFEVTKLTASATKVTIEFRYPVEGVVGNVVFRKRHGTWQLDKKRVAEQ